ncbi:MAG TPA: hypothetical protein VM841_03050 [Actinomycetota bacterium]|nr:hypothetical protein [Actinomycetota bacterium]
MRKTRALLAVVSLAASLAAPARPARAAAFEIGRLVAAKPAAVAVDPSIHAMFVAGQDGGLWIYDTRTYASRTVELTCCLVAAVADAATHRVYVSGNGLIVLDGVAGVVRATVSLAPGTPEALALDSAGGRLYVADPPGDRVVVLDTATDTIVSSIPVRDRPAGLAIDPAAGVLYVASGGEEMVDAIDVSTGATIASAPVAAPSGIATGNGEIYVASGEGAVVALRAGTLAAVRSIATGAMPRSVAYNPVSNRLWVANWGSGTVSFVDPVTGTVLGTMPSGTRPSHVAFDAGLGRTYVAVAGSDEVQLLHERAATISIATPGEGQIVGPAKRTIAGSAPPGAPVTIFEGAAPAGSGFAGPTGAFSIQVSLGEGTRTVVAAVPYEPYSAPRTFTVDLTTPVIEHAGRTPAGPSGWNNTPVRLTWTCTDALSGVKSEQIEKLLGFDGRGQSATATCEDRAGNTASHTVTGIDIDLRGPVISMSRSPAATAGWNRTSPVTVAFTCADTMSGMPSPSSRSVTVSGETDGTEVAHQCADVAGNVSSRVEVVRIDSIAPVASVDQTVPAMTRLPVEIDGTLRSGITGSVTDWASGPVAADVRFSDESGLERVVAASCASGCGSGAIRWRVRPPPSMNPGWYEVSARGTDLAGNVGGWSAPARIFIATGEEWPRIPLPNLPI